MNYELVTEDNLFTKICKKSILCLLKYLVTYIFRIDNQNGSIIKMSKVHSYIYVVLCYIYI